MDEGCIHKHDCAAGSVCRFRAVGKNSDCFLHVGVLIAQKCQKNIAANLPISQGAYEGGKVSRLGTIHLDVHEEPMLTHCDAEWELAVTENLRGVC